MEINENIEVLAIQLKTKREKEDRRNVRGVYVVINLLHYVFIRLSAKILP